MRKRLQNVVIIIVLLMISSYTVPVKASPYFLDRLECVKFIVRNSGIDYWSEDFFSCLEKFEDAGNLNFSDTEMVAAAVKYKIIDGYEDNTLRLSDNVTRAEFACMIYRSKAFFGLATNVISYDGGYTDLSEWNRTEIIYCIENGYMMGCGDKFGSDDFITSEQLGIIKRRLQFGLSTREKYSLMNICGICPVSYENMLLSAYDEELGFEDASNYGNVGDESTAKFLLNILDKIGNLDSDKFKNEDYLKDWKEDFMYQTPPVGEYVPYPVFISDLPCKNIDDIFKYVMEYNIKRESIHVLAPQNTLEIGYPGGYEILKGCGYEYFMYVGCDITDNMPELNVWYRRKYEISFENSGRLGFPDYLTVKYGEIEKYSN